jgi:hypothetical protein
MGRAIPCPQGLDAVEKIPAKVGPVDIELKAFAKIFPGDLVQLQYLGVELQGLQLCPGGGIFSQVQIGIGVRLHHIPNDRFHFVKRDDAR